MTSTYLGSKGYSIYKECLTIKEQELIRRELTVKAFVPKSCINQPIPFPIYRESMKKMYLHDFMESILMVNQMRRGFRKDYPSISNLRETYDPSKNLL